MVISASLQACGVVFPFAMPTSICRSIVTICSGLYLLIGMTRFSSKWILSHSTWYKFRPSRHLLKNSVFAPNRQNLGDRKCLGDPRKSLVGLPNAILFLRISPVGVFQQPQAITLIDPAPYHPRGVVRGGGRVGGA